MKLKWPINLRSKNKGNKVAPELEQYYTTERRERIGLAWLLALATLLATVAVVLGLFFAGRWVWHKIDGKGTKPETTSQGENTSVTLNEPTDTSSAEDTTPTTPSPTPVPSTTTPNTTAQNSNLPSTGPGGTIAAFVISTALGTGLFQLHLRRKPR